jgi:hypothetical protein
LKTALFNDLFIYFDYSKLFKLNNIFNNTLYYNQYNGLNRLFINRAFRKLNKCYSFFKIYKSRDIRKLKFFFTRLIKLLRYDDFNVINKSCAFLGKGKMVKFKSKVEAPSFLIAKKKKKKVNKINFLYKRCAEAVWQFL